jgi:CRISPR-associated exonuclease Cas4
MTILPLVAPSERPTPVLRVSDLRQWTYCPRVVWWTHVCPVGKVESFKMRMGLLKERRLQRLQKRRTLRAFGLKQGQVEHNVSLFSEALGLSGRLDMLIRWGAVRYPVEIKFTHGPARLNHRLQLAGYALLLEAAYGVPVTHGYVVRLPDDTVDHVAIDAPLRDLTWKTIAALRRTIDHEQLPPANPLLARCTDCEYLRYCGDLPQP